MPPQIDLSRLEDDDSDSSGEELEENDDEDDDDDEEEDIALSDLESVASDEKGDIIPHQRLTINNTSALLAAVHRIEWKTKKQPFSDHQAVTSDAAIEIQDTNDDLNRELAFYQQALAAVNTARDALKKEGVPFTRPNDYFAEMVKSDEHMGKIKQKLIDEAAGKKAAAEARRQRDLKKFGKAVQIAKEQEKAKAKKDTIEKINLLKRSTSSIIFPSPFLFQAPKLTSLSFLQQNAKVPTWKTRRKTISSTSPSKTPRRRPARTSSPAAAVPAVAAVMAPTLSAPRRMPNTASAARSASPRAMTRRAAPMAGDSQSRR